MTPPGAVVVSLVAVELVRPLRQVVLRPGMAPEESIYPGDDDQRAAHGAARLPSDDRPGPIVAVGTILAEAPPWASAEERARGLEGVAAVSWRIRGMATAEGYRGQGLGRHVLEALLAHAEAHSATACVVWCNARVRATAFYGRAGFVAVGATFELPGIGPHQAMERTP